MAYKVLIVDDSKLARMPVARALATLQPDWTQAGAATADDAVAPLTDQALADFLSGAQRRLRTAGRCAARQPSCCLS
jgi:hypothetical protein